MMSMDWLLQQLKVMSIRDLEVNKEEMHTLPTLRFAQFLG